MPLNQLWVADKSKSKQWRWVRTKIKHLLALGVSLKTAIQHGVSSKR